MWPPLQALFKAISPIYWFFVNPLSPPSLPPSLPPKNRIFQSNPLILKFFILTPTHRLKSLNIWSEIWRQPLKTFFNVFQNEIRPNEIENENLCKGLLCLYAAYFLCDLIMQKKKELNFYFTLRLGRNILATYSRLLLRLKTNKTFNN